jgi:hypothetical protein
MFATAYCGGFVDPDVDAGVAWSRRYRWRVRHCVTRTKGYLRVFTLALAM